MKIIEKSNFQPRESSSFLVKFPESFKLPSWVVQKLTGISFTDGKWNNIKIEFINPTEPSISKILLEIIKFINNKNKILFNLEIEMIDPTGVVIETWVIEVENIITINFGELSYRTDDIIKPFLILTPYNCYLK